MQTTPVVHNIRSRWPLPTVTGHTWWIGCENYLDDLTCVMPPDSYVCIRMIQTCFVDHDIFWWIAFVQLVVSNVNCTQSWSYAIAAVSEVKVIVKSQACIRHNRLSNKFFWKVKCQVKHWNQYQYHLIFTSSAKVWTRNSPSNAGASINQLAWPTMPSAGECHHLMFMRCGFSELYPETIYIRSISLYNLKHSLRSIMRSYLYDLNIFQQQWQFWQ